jgi:symplekin
MAADATSAGASQIAQLNHARTLALEDPTMYSKLLPAILPILNSINSPSPELKAWGADFLAEIFSSPTVPTDEKQNMAVQALPVLREFLELPGGASATSVEQAGMAKSAIQAASSVYPLIFRYM